MRDELGLGIITEAIDNESLDLVEKYADVIQIGARNMQNFSLLKRAGRARKPVLLKRGMSATLDEFLMAAEYVMSEGNYNVILCERGVRTFSDHTRNTLDLSVVPAVQRLSHLPIAVDPSHGTGRRNKVLPLSRAAVAVGADGLLVEVHHDPDRALSDGPQSILPEEFDALSSRSARDRRRRRPQNQLSPACASCTPRQQRFVCMRTCAHRTFAPQLAPRISTAPARSASPFVKWPTSCALRFFVPACTFSPTSATPATAPSLPSTWSALTPRNYPVGAGPPACARIPRARKFGGSAPPAATRGCSTRTTAESSRTFPWERLPTRWNFSPDGTRAYVAASGSNTVVEIDCASRQVVGRGPRRAPSLDRARLARTAKFSSSRITTTPRVSLFDAASLSLLAR